MPRILARCPYCSRIFGLSVGGYTAMRAALTEHMLACERRPEDQTEEEILREVEQIMEDVQRDA